MSTTVVTQLVLFVRHDAMNNSHGRPQGHWKRIEDDMLYLIMWPETTCNDWNEVARWMEVYLPNCRRRPFTHEETTRLADLLPISKSWASLARHFPGRPARLIKEECRKLRWSRVMSPASLT
ncbi:hypothetical protein ACHHYP_07256 [Achlya hypogyna]|uniref:Myb-like domain-containing protein n=1 Tax=Achlya hypogyna TaxID=1202772 RepID=A0A1V9ZME4_ACHHY|nr:hypothetical protein ACHHYP_07256 [Achlya hypogyna]